MCVKSKNKQTTLLLMYMLFLDVGPPGCDALSHHVCPEHGAYPVPTVAPKSRGAGAGPCAPPTPRREGWPACQLRHTDGQVDTQTGRGWVGQRQMEK